MSVERMRAYWVYVVVFAAVVWLIRSCAAGEPRESCHIVRVPTGGGFDCGSSTAIAPTWLVTNHHVVKDGTGRAIVEGMNGVVRAQMPAADLALVEVPEANFVPAELGDDPKPGQTVRAIGFPHAGPMADRTAQVLSFGQWRMDSTYNVPVVIASYQSISGDSGGGVFDADGRLVAVTWGGSEDGGHSVPVSYVKQLMQQCPSCPQPSYGRRIVSAPPVQPSAPRPEPRPPAPSPPPTAPAPPQVVKGEPGPAGPAGPPGPQGPPGPPGAGANIDLDALCAKLAASIGCKCEDKKPEQSSQPEPQPPPATPPTGPEPSPDPHLSHYALVADTDADYWSRTESELVGARAKFKKIHLVHSTEVPWPVKTLPQLVAYDTQGAALSIVKGQRDVEHTLRLIARGELPGG